MLLVAYLLACAISARCRGRRVAVDQYGGPPPIRPLAVSVALKCHSTHMFSRRP
jgi:hypothetical protein